MSAITILTIIAALIITGWMVHDIQAMAEHHVYRKHFED